MLEGISCRLRNVNIQAGNRLLVSQARNQQRRKTEQIAKARRIVFMRKIIGFVVAANQSFGRRIDIRKKAPLSHPAETLGPPVARRVVAGKTAAKIPRNPVFAVAPTIRPTPDKILENLILPPRFILAPDNQAVRRTVRQSVSCRHIGILPVLKHVRRLRRPTHTRIRPGIRIAVAHLRRILPGIRHMRLVHVNPTAIRGNAGSPQRPAIPVNERNRQTREKRQNNKRLGTCHAPNKHESHSRIQQQNPPRPSRPRKKEPRINTNPHE